jgi:hypothetical protein
VKPAQGDAAEMNLSEVEIAIVVIQEKYEVERERARRLWIQHIR